MRSEFYHVDLDRVRYSIVWEDSRTLFNGLNITAEDHLLIISSAGCNVLNVLLTGAASVTAIDINPIQNKLLLLKKHIILRHDYAVYRALLGIDGPSSVASAINALRQTLPPDDVAFWEGFFEAHPEGLLVCGKLENYIHGFFGTLSMEDQLNVRKLLTCTTIASQYDHFIDKLDSGSFKQAFIHWFADENLSKGRDPRLLKYAEESGGQAFYSRLKRQAETLLLKDNFYFRFFFFGIDDMPSDLLPPCYQQENYELLRQNLPHLNVVTDGAVEYLLSEAGSGITKASLSNIFEYTSHADFRDAINNLSATRKAPLRIIFWNLLHEQGEGKPRVNESSQSCFYFKNVVQLVITPTIS